MIIKYIYKFSAIFFILAFLLLTNPKHIFAEGINIQPSELRENTTFNVNVLNTTANTCYAIFFKKSDGNYLKSGIAPTCGPTGDPLFTPNIYKTMKTDGSGIQFQIDGGIPQGTYGYEIWKESCFVICNYNDKVITGTLIVSAGATVCGGPFDCPSGVCLANGTCAPGGPAATPTDAPFAGGSAGGCWEPNSDRSDCIYICKDQRQGPYLTKEICLKAIGSVTQTPQSPLICDPGAKTCKTAFGLTIDVSKPTAFISQLMGIILGIAGAIAVILIIIAGYTYMTSGGDKQKVAGARETLISAITGLLFIVFSLAILGFIGFNVLKIPGFV